MRLYSFKHIIMTAVISAVISAAFVAFINKAVHVSGIVETDLTGSMADGTQANLDDALGQEIDIDDVSGAEFVLETNSPVLQVANDNKEYTQDEFQNISVYEKCNEAVVNITTQVMSTNWFWEPVLTSGGSGSGSIIDKRGYVITNVHVIDNATKITISLHDGTSYDGTVVGKDVESDIAVLKFTPPKDKELKTIAFGDSENLKVGQKVIAIGNPFALERTMTTGIISGLGRPIQESENVIIRNMIQTDAAINPGNSGGPLLDSLGRMIGVNTIIYSSSGSSSGVGFAVPVSTARRVVNELIQYGKVNRGVMMVSLVQNSSSLARYAGYGISTGMIVSRIRSGSQAEAAGLKGGTTAVRYGTFNVKTIYLGGDIITAIGDIQVNTLADYYAALEDKVPGDKVDVTVYRNKKYEKLTVQLESEENTSGGSSI